MTVVLLLLCIIIIIIIIIITISIIIIILSIITKIVTSPISQISALSKNSAWIECHERMARWFVLMDHYMKNEQGVYGHNRDICSEEKNDRE